MLKFYMSFLLVIDVIFSSDYDYAIQIDAGSSGSRMFVYEFHSNFKNSIDSNVTIRQIGLCKAKGKGISSIKTLHETSGSFQKCLKIAHNLIPHSKWNKTLITLKATAGMRLLELDNPSISKNVYNIIREYFNQTGFLYKDESQVQTISGKEEGLNAWITANFLDQNFQKNKTRGILDLGGASTQISFVPYNVSESEERIKLFGVNYNFFSKSFLCYGVDQANLVYQTNLLKSNNSSYNISAACLPIGFRKIYLNTDIYSSPCVSGTINNESITFDLLNYTLFGASDYETCRKDIRSFFNSKKKCQSGQDFCSFKSVRLPSTNGNDFYGISVFYYTLRASNILFNSTFNSDIDSFRNVSKILCSLTYDDLLRLNELYDADLFNYLPRLCFQSIYIVELLAKFGINSFENIKFVEKINGYDVGWNLGYLINELNN